MLVYNSLDENHYQLVAGVTGLEPATSGVTGQRCNQPTIPFVIKTYLKKYKYLKLLTFMHIL